MSIYNSDNDNKNKESDERARQGIYMIQLDVEELLFVRSIAFTVAIKLTKTLI